MKLTSELNKKAWAIRKEAAKKWNCPVSEIVWVMCLQLAKEKKMDLTTLTIEELETLKTKIESEIESRQDTDTISIEIEDGCIDQSDINYENHKRGRNWIATVQNNKKAPGGYDRDFWDRASGSYKEIPENLKAGDKIEVAADYSTASGSRRPDREYYKVISVTGTKLTLSEIDG